MCTVLCLCSVFNSRCSYSKSAVTSYKSILKSSQHSGSASPSPWPFPFSSPELLMTHRLDAVCRTGGLIFFCFLHPCAHFVHLYNTLPLLKFPSGASQLPGYWYCAAAVVLFKSNQVEVMHNQDSFKMWSANNYTGVQCGFWRWCIVRGDVSWLVWAALAFLGRQAARLSYPGTELRQLLMILLRDTNKCSPEKKRRMLSGIPGDWFLTSPC